MLSAAEHPWVVQDYRLKECGEGRVVAPSALLYYLKHE